MTAKLCFFQVCNSYLENTQIDTAFICPKDELLIQARIAQLVAYRLGTGEVPGSNPGKCENFSVKTTMKEYPQVRKTGVDAVYEKAAHRRSIS